jgi:hypothetical protein
MVVAVMVGEMVAVMIVVGLEVVGLEVVVG